MSENNYYKKLYQKNELSKKVDFVTTTEFFVNQFATTKQLNALHYGLLNLDVIHSNNNCTTNSITTCKQNINTLIYLHSYYDLLDDIDSNKSRDKYVEVFKPLVGSYFVGEYFNQESGTDFAFILDKKFISKKARPIFLTEDGEFRDYRFNLYQPDYVYNIRNKNSIELPPKYSPENMQKLFMYRHKLLQKGNIQLIAKFDKFMKKIGKENYRFIHNYSFVIRGYYPNIKNILYRSKQTINTFSLENYTNTLSEVYDDTNIDLTDFQRERIMSNLFDIDILINTLEIVSSKPNLKKTFKNNNKILVGVSEYSRNFNNGEISLIFLDYKGQFVDEIGGYYWPLYETCIYKNTPSLEGENNEEKTYSLYSFTRILSNDPSSDINSLFGKYGFTNDLIVNNYYFNNPYSGHLHKVGTGLIEFIKYITVIPFTLIDLHWIKQTASHFVKWGFFSNNEKYIENEKAETIELESKMYDEQYNNYTEIKGGGIDNISDDELNQLKDNLLEYIQLKENMKNGNFAINEFSNNDKFSIILEKIHKYYNEKLNKEIDNLLKDNSESLLPDITETTLTNCQRSFISKYNDINNDFISKLEQSKLDSIIKVIKKCVCNEETYNIIISEKINFNKYFLASFKTSKNDIIKSTFEKSEGFTDEEKTFLIKLNEEASKKAFEISNNYSITSKKQTNELGYIMSKQLISNLLLNIELNNLIIKLIDEIYTNTITDKKVNNYKEMVIHLLENEKQQLDVSKNTFDKMKIIAK